VFYHHIVFTVKGLLVFIRREGQRAQVPFLASEVLLFSFITVIKLKLYIVC